MGMFQNFMLKQALKSKLKDLPEEQREMVLKAVEKNPEFFKKIGDEIQRRVKAGSSEMAATMSVMRENQGELQKLMK